MAVQLPEAGRLCLQQLRRSTRHTRPFSSSLRRRRNGPIAAFPATSSPELDDILTKLRESIFLPSHLPVQQRHVIYRKHFQHYLTGEEPVTVTLPTVGPGANAKSSDASQESGSTESFNLRPLNRVVDEPRKAQTFNRILDLIRGKPDDWIVVPELIRELHKSGRSLKPAQIEKLIRRATAEGKLGAIVDCFHRSKENGLNLSTEGIARQIILGAHQRATMAGWDEAELNKAIKNIEAAIAFAPIQRRDKEAKYSMITAELKGAAMALVAARRWLWQTTNTPEARAARAAEETPTPESPEGEAADGGATAEVAEEQSTADQATAEPGELYPRGKEDLALIELWAQEMLDQSTSAKLSFDLDNFTEAADALWRWAPTWFGIQLVERLLPANSPITERLRGAFDADIDPLVKSAHTAFLKLKKPELEGYRELQVYRAYNEFLA